MISRKVLDSGLSSLLYLREKYTNLQSKHSDKFTETPFFLDSRFHVVSDNLKNIWLLWPNILGSLKTSFNFQWLV